MDSNVLTSWTAVDRGLGDLAHALDAERLSPTDISINAALDELSRSHPEIPTEAEALASVEESR